MAIVLALVIMLKHLFDPYIELPYDDPHMFTSLCLSSLKSACLSSTELI